MPTIYCVGRNYAAHVREMEGSGRDLGEPIIFLKPWHALVRPPLRIELPPDAGEIHHEAELVVRVGADQTAAEVALGLDLTDRTRQAEAKKRGMPWAAAKGFRSSAAVGPFVPLPTAPPLGATRFSLRVNDDIRQQGDTALMLLPVEQLLEGIASWFGLGEGDLVFTGTPEGVGPVRKGDLLELEMEGVNEAGAQFEVG